MISAVLFSIRFLLIFIIYANADTNTAVDFLVCQKMLTFIYALIFLIFDKVLY